MHTWVAFLAGLTLGLSMILPIGPQNVFVLTQGLLGGIRRGLAAATIAGLCDTTLIVLGGSGVSRLFATHPVLQEIFLWLGVGFLGYMGYQSLRVRKNNTTDEVDPPKNGSLRGALRGILTTGVAVSWGNPHAILDTTVILGSAIASQSVANRVWFAAGTIAASWLFFTVLAVAGARFGARVGADARLWTSRISGVIMLGFAILFVYKALGNWF